jgi:hypothetical protein
MVSCLFLFWYPRKSLISHRVTDATIERLSFRSARVQKLILRRCTRITPQIFQVISERCPFLIALDVAYCPNITLPPVLELLRHNPRMRELSVAGCQKIQSLATLLQEVG